MSDIFQQLLPENNSIWQETLHWQPTPQQQARYQRLYELVLAGNRQLNLTRITEPQDFWEKHLWDSLRGILPLLPGGESGEKVEKIIDIGTGAGFPGLPIAIALAKVEVTLLDSTRKKINFIETLLGDLGIKNALTLTARVEDAGRMSEGRELYDVATVRAVAAPSVCAEYALPLLKKGGLGILYRGDFTQEEERGLTKALKKLGGEIEAIAPLTTPLSKSDRHYLYVRKIGATPDKFPRSVGVARQKPL
jgi:16S rRNA (guanine527-N7)-methyltransferase